MVDRALLAWLLESDPSLRWQVQRDLADEPEDVWSATRASVATEGFGARLLSLQDEDGRWAGGAYFPADASEEEAGQPWTATTWSLGALREWGVEPSALRPDTAGLLARNARWEYDDLPYWGGEVDACVNGCTLADGAWLGADVTAIADWFLDHRLADGGWNCEWVEGSTRSSFHSTLNSLVGLLDHEARTGGSPALRQARHDGEGYLLQRGLVRRSSTGQVHAPWATHLAYPYRWYYSTLRALDYLRAAALHDDRPPDERMAEAVELVREARDADGTWHQQLRHEGRTWFDVDASPGEASRWLTFHALRVLTWWDTRPPPPGASNREAAEEASPAPRLPAPSTASPLHPDERPGTAPIALGPG
ncbi:squalene cyclase [uncultured Pseudokineococcus sp.]|uniref:squalene cyclase n=1 Tax=uncultured Pseudokineococcus sp. TaxID=1642928 RepID=UPI002614C77E|nr:squalene cyclase [uncultured Pseudokineococcus sp.]